jgi:hypothetical protein
MTTRVSANMLKRDTDKSAAIPNNLRIANSSLLYYLQFGVHDFYAEFGKAFAVAGAL